MRPAVNSRSRLYQINRSQRWPGYTATVYVIKFGQGTYVSGTTYYAEAQYKSPALFRAKIVHIKDYWPFYACLAIFRDVYCKS